MNTKQKLQNFRLKIQINLLARKVKKMISLIGTLKTSKDHEKAIKKGERLKKRADKLASKILKHQQEAKYFPRAQQFDSNVKRPLAATMVNFEKGKEAVGKEKGKNSDSMRLTEFKKASNSKKSIDSRLLKTKKPAKKKLNQRRRPSL